jgi:hypothetical protein
MATYTPISEDRIRYKQVSLLIAEMVVQRHPLFRRIDEFVARFPTRHRSSFVVVLWADQTMQWQSADHPLVAETVPWLKYMTRSVVIAVVDADAAAHWICRRPTRVDFLLKGEWIPNRMVEGLAIRDSLQRE